MFAKDNSVFAQWKEDNKTILDKVCEHDFENWKLQKVVKDARDVSSYFDGWPVLKYVNLCESIREETPLLKDIFLDI